MKYGIYLHGELMESFNTSTEAYDAARFATEETGIVHEVKIHNFQIVKDFDVDNIDGCEFVKSSVSGKLLISFHHDYESGYPTGKIQVVYPDGSSGLLDCNEAQRKVDSGEWTVYR
ncbi:hypothetical protein [Metabacillus fastidiosus]|uniref:hypothetical protein n=1 Tax=Metabacillus fastidiosus TaxID=1458 RepID=UPI003D276BEC